MSSAAVPRRNATAAAALLTAACAGAAAAVGAGGRVGVAGAALASALVIAAVAARRPVIHWEHVIGLVLIVILFIPVNRYKFPWDLPFDVEPYRLLVAVALAAWGLSLLVDPRVTLRRSGLEAPIALILVSVAGSIAFNLGRVAALQPTVIKAATFLASFFAIFFLVVSVVRSEKAALYLSKLLVGGGGILGVLAVIEARAGVQPFIQLDRVFPFLVTDATSGVIARGGTMRAFGSAEHPIALGAALVLLLPLAVYVIRVSGARWYLPLGAISIGALATVSRTGIVMLVVIGAVFLALKPRETRRLWPLVVPLIVITHFAAPGTLGSLKQSFQPTGGLVAQQQNTTGDCDADGRVADLDPTLAEVAKKPLLGYGYGTRITTGPEKNACILDSQWLATLVDVGVVGFVAWWWFFLSVVRRFGGYAKADASATGWLVAAATASAAAYAAGMFTFDAMGFTQVTFLLFVILGLGAAAAARGREASRAE